MAFTNSDSIVATDLNNMLRGLVRDNTDRAVTGTTNETDLSSQTITGGAITATGGLLVVAAGTVTGAAGTKRIRLYFGATAIADTTAVSGTADWYIISWIFNTATGAQRVLSIFSDPTNATNHNMDTTTAAIDTTANVTLEVTGQLGAGGDTITQTLMDVMIIQIT